VAYVSLDPKELETPKLQAYMQGVIVPRPIALASTIDKEGQVNLSPFSFFNMVSTRPPVLVFSPSRRVRDNTTKHTLENITEVPEVVINIANYQMVEQVSLASCEYPKGVNEFRKSGLTELPSVNVKPPRVKESPASFECKVNQIIPLGGEGGAGNIIVCEVLLIHLKKEILDSSTVINPHNLDAVARMGADFYCRAQGENIFVLPKPNQKLGIGFDQLPEAILTSQVLTGNDLARLANVSQLPASHVLQKATNDYHIHLDAKKLLSEGKAEEAWKILLQH
jgi:flavin reductase (DIM6/NTAB) family NADH-FMN oxidoreductase RutF